MYDYSHRSFLSARGGRVSATAAVFGSMLGVKPILTFDHEGKLKTIDKVKGMKRVYAYTLEKLASAPPDEKKKNRGGTYRQRGSRKRNGETRGRSHGNSARSLYYGTFDRSARGARRGGVRVAFHQIENGFGTLSLRYFEKDDKFVNLRGVPARHRRKRKE